MSKYRRAAKIDANQNAIVNQLRAMSISVVPGHDDILVGYKGSTYWFEIKTGEKSEIKPSQKKLLAEYKGHYSIVWSLEMILKELKK